MFTPQVYNTRYDWFINNHTNMENSEFPYKTFQSVMNEKAKETFQNPIDKPEDFALSLWKLFDSQFPDYYIILTIKDSSIIIDENGNLAHHQNVIIDVYDDVTIESKR